MSDEHARLIAMWVARRSELESEARDHERAAAVARAQADRMTANIQAAHEAAGENLTPTVDSLES